MWPVELLIPGRLNYWYAAHRIADGTEAASASTSVHRQRRWAEAASRGCLRAIWVCICGSVVVGGLVLCGSVGVDMWETVSLVDWFVGAVWRVCLWKPETLVSSRSKSSMAGVYVVGT